MNSLARLTAVVVSLAPSCFGQPITVYNNLPYTSAGCTDPRLDLYLPAGPLAPNAATIVYMHSGGWNSGDKSTPATLCAELARRGYPTISINYTLSAPHFTSHPQCIRDVKAAIRWVRTVGADTYNLPWRVFTAGDSAGGHLAMMGAVTPNVARFNPAGDPPPGGYAVQGCVSIYGVSNFIWDVETGGQDPGIWAYLTILLTAQTRPIYYEASPINYVSPCNPPFLLFHALGDSIVPYQHSVMMADALTRVGVPAQLVLTASNEHGFYAFGGQVSLASQIAAAIPTMSSSGVISGDFNLDGGADGADVSDFFASWELADESADVNHDGAVDGSDVQDFFAAWERGDVTCSG
ncbi:MAG: alpha/beta hydrolase fold domain-containing protein [Planctomycetes bacterium]|nr:alpha/beta hydrolase fold domain-containing protein [Planctomycetota bacterium]